MSIPLPKSLLSSTVYLKNQFGNVGTGFMLQKKLKDGKRSVFLITNKHVLRKDGIGPYSKYIDIRLYSKQLEGIKPTAEIIRLPLLKKDNTFNNIVFMHSKESVDIAGILISDIVNKLFEKIDFTFFDEEIILTRKIAKDEYIDAGEDVVILGYPAGIFSNTNYLPLVKSGLLSSSSSEDLNITLSGGKVIKGKIYLVDAALFGGNSGGPVFVKPRSKVTRRKEGKKNWIQEVQMHKMLPIYLLGVQSSSIQISDKIYTRIFKLEEPQEIKAKENILKKSEKDKVGEYIPVEKEIMLNIVFSAEYIIDIFNDYEKWYETNKSIPQQKEKEE